MDDLVTRHERKCVTVKTDSSVIIGGWEKVVSVTRDFDWDTNRVGWKVKRRVLTRN